jgi:8-oxo-dGTP pyrophosphatase MutT (NUDIX family)
VGGRDSVAIVAVDDELRVTLVELVRYTTGEASIELPAGGVDGDEPLAAAKRELQEETGITAGQWKCLGALRPDDGIRRNTLHVFLATELVRSSDHDQETEGITGLVLAPLLDAPRMFHSGEMTDSESAGPLLLAAVEFGLL